MITNHWGVKVDSEVPVTGVLLARDPEWLYEAAYDRGIDLSMEEHLKDGCQEEDHCFCDLGEELLLIGFRQCPDGKYEPDPKAEYSVIIHDIHAQVVRSKWASRAALCSPCYPGSGDLGTEGDYLAYTLPEELWGDGKHLSILEWPFLAHESRPWGDGKHLSILEWPLRVIARFHPQAWIDNQCVDVDPEGPVEFDVASQISTADREMALAIRDNTAASDNLLADATDLPEWIWLWDGPYWVEVEEAIRRYFEGKD